MYSMALYYVLCMVPSGKLHNEFDNKGYKCAKLHVLHELLQNLEVFFFGGGLDLQIHVIHRTKAHQAKLHVMSYSSNQVSD